MEEMITVMEGIRRTEKEVSLMDHPTIELVVITITKATRLTGITEKIGVDIVNESHQVGVVSNMKAWSSTAHLLAFLRLLLHPKNKQLLSRPHQSAWKK